MSSFGPGRMQRWAALEQWLVIIKVHRDPFGGRRYILRALLVLGTGLMFARAVLLSVNARSRTIDTPTQNAITAWRAGAVAIVAALPDNKNVSGDQLSATYNGTVVLPSQQANTLMVVKGRAEQASWTALDPHLARADQELFRSRSRRGPLIDLTARASKSTQAELSP